MVELATMLTEHGERVVCVLIFDCKAKRGVLSSRATFANEEEAVAYN